MKKTKFHIPKKLIPYVNNRYVLTFLGALIWLSFFDRNDFITTYTYQKKLKGLQNEKTYYESEVIRYTEDLNNLLSNPANMEKYAREKYYMKKDNEDLFVIIDESKKMSGP